jgi:hypothetical protein
VNHDGLAGLGGDFQLLLEHRALHLARRKVVVVIEADLAHGQHLGMRGQLSQAREGLGGGFRSVVRVHPDGGEYKRIALRLADGRLQIGRAAAGPDGHHALHARGQRALDYRLAVRVEFRVVQMNV